MAKRSAYKAGKTIWKFVKATGVLGAGAVAATTFPDEGADAMQWFIFAASVSPPILTAASNFVKNINKTVDELTESERNGVYQGCLILLLGLQLAFLSFGSSGYIA